MSDPSAQPARDGLASAPPAGALSERHRLSTTPVDRLPGKPTGAEPQSLASPLVRSPFLVAVAGWVLPGAGYWLIGQRARGVTVCIAILLLFAAGLFVGGVRVIDVPGYEEAGVRRVTGDGRWMLYAQPMATLLDKPWYLGQIFVGPATLAASYGSIKAARHEYPKGTAHVAEFGTLYCAVAGMLNLLVIIDATARAQAGAEEAKSEKREA